MKSTTITAWGEGHGGCAGDIGNPAIVAGTTLLATSFEVTGTAVKANMAVKFGPVSYHGTSGPRDASVSMVRGGCGAR